MNNKTISIEQKWSQECPLCGDTPCMWIVLPNKQMIIECSNRCDTSGLNIRIDIVEKELAFSSYTYFNGVVLK